MAELARPPRQVAGMKSSNAIGQHVLADLFGIAPERLADSVSLAELLKDAAKRSGLNALAEPIVVPFKAPTTGGQAGVTGFIVLAESHIAFHSYPEWGFMAVDVFTCGTNAHPQAALDVFVERLKPEETVTHRWARGRL